MVMQGVAGVDGSEDVSGGGSLQFVGSPSVGSVDWGSRHGGADNSSSVLSSVEQNREREREN